MPINCTLPLWPSLDQQSCICRNNSIVSADGKSCGCCSNMQYDASSESCSCPSPMNWDATAKACTCPAGLIIKGNTCVCEFPKIPDPKNPLNCICPSSMTKAADGSCICQGNMILNSDKSGCVCGNNTVWNPATNNCDCDQTFILDPVTKQCVCPKQQAIGSIGLCVCKSNLQPVPGTLDQCMCPVPLIQQGDQCVCPGGATLGADGKTCTPAKPSSGSSSTSLWIIVGLIVVVVVIGAVVLKKQ